MGARFPALGKGVRNNKLMVSEWNRRFQDELVVFKIDGWMDRENKKERSTEEWRE